MLGTTILPKDRHAINRVITSLTHPCRRTRMTHHSHYREEHFREPEWEFYGVSQD